MKSSLAVSALLTAVLVLSPAVSHAHSGPAPLSWKRDNLAAREGLEHRCAGTLAHRRARRAEEAWDAVLARSEIDSKENLNLSGLRVSARRSSNKDSTALVTPEVTQGPYHVLGEIVRQNMTEGQAGVPLEISIDFIDVTTCEPVKNYWIDMWQCNSTGQYAHYGAITVGGGGDFPSGPDPATTTLGPYSGVDDPAVADFLNTPTVDNDTFLRAIYPTDERGHLRAYTVFPGWYSGRAQHFHIKVYAEGYIAENGTFVANSSATHTGQFFFDADTLDAVRRTNPYNTNLIPWNESVANENDQWYPYQSATGYDAEMAITWLGHRLEDGLIGSITVAVNTSFASPELSTQYSDFNVTKYLEEGMLPFASSDAAGPMDTLATFGRAT